MDPIAKLKQLCPELADLPACLDAAAGYLARLPSLDGEPERYASGLRAVMANERDTAAEIAAVASVTAMSADVSVRGDLLAGVGLHHHRLGDLAGAQALFEQALAVDRAVLGPRHPSVARDWNQLGLVARDRFDLPAAQAAFSTALAIAEAGQGGAHPLVARYVNNLGTVLLDMGDAVGALAAFQRAFRIDTDAFGHDHVNVAIRASNLGNALRLFDDFPEARGAYACAHDIFLRRLGPDHINTRTVAANLRALGDHG